MGEKINEENDYILTLYLFELKQLILIDVPNCKKTETSSKGFLKKFHDYTKSKQNGLSKICFG